MSKAACLIVREREHSVRPQVRIAAFVNAPKPASTFNANVQTLRDLFICIGVVVGALRSTANVALCARDCNVNPFSTIIIKSFN